MNKINRVSLSLAAGNRVLDDDQTTLQIDLPVNDIPSDEDHEDEQYMQSITKHIEKLDLKGRSRDENL